MLARTMHEYDSTLKLLLQGSAPETVRALTGTAVNRWLNVELPKVQNLRCEIVGRTPWSATGPLARRWSG
jgi:hypothetical protein